MSELKGSRARSVVAAAFGLLSLVPARGEAQAQVVGTVEQVRSALTFPEYTAEEKQLVAEQAQHLLAGFYVNRHIKTARYGASVDAVPAIADVVEHATELSSKELNTRIQHIFKSQRDLHLNYDFPKPLGCFASVVPVYFQEYFGDDRPVAVQSKIPGFEQILPQIDGIEVGDTLVSYNGKPARTAIEELIVAGAGANDFGGYAGGIGLLNVRFNRFNELPVEDEVVLELARADGSTYDVTIPWLAFQLSNCLQPQTPQTPAATELAQASEPSQLLSTDIFDVAADSLSRAGVVLNPSAYPILSWGKLQVKGDTYGVIRLSSFSFSPVTDTSDLRPFVEEFARVLQAELGDTAGLIIDIRSNGGGFAYLSERLPELFSDDPVPPTFARLIKTDFMRTWLANSVEPYFQFEGSTLDGSAPNANYGALFPAFFTPDPAFDRAYFEPVAILNNGSCYSACDFFSARMQDHGLATIWGEDLKTGAGGANVWDNNFLMGFQPADGPLKPLPFGQTMRVSWGQAVRGGAYQGQLIEDLGVVADRRARPSLDDLVNGGDSQLRRIASDLRWQRYDFR